MATRRGRNTGSGLLGPGPSSLPQNSPDFAWRLRPGLLPAPSRSQGLVGPPGAGGFSPRAQAVPGQFYPLAQSLGNLNVSATVGGCAGNRHDVSTVQDSGQLRGNGHPGNSGRRGGRRSWGTKQNYMAKGIASLPQQVVISPQLNQQRFPVQRNDFIPPIQMTSPSQPLVSFVKGPSHSSAELLRHSVPEADGERQWRQPPILNHPKPKPTWSDDEAPKKASKPPPRRRCAGVEQGVGGDSSSSSDAESSSGSNNEYGRPVRRIVRKGELNEKKTLPKRRVVPDEKRNKRSEAIKHIEFDAVVDVLLSSEGRTCEMKQLSRRTGVSGDSVSKMGRKYYRIIKIFANGCVMLHCMVAVCDRFLNSEDHDDDDCGLHICADWLTGDGRCEKGSRCPLGHDLRERKDALERLGFGGVDIKTTEKILRHVVGQKRLPIGLCKDYFVHNGQCNNGQQCSKLHLCPGEIMSDMACEDDCKMNHDWKDDSCVRVFRSVGVDSRVSLRELKAKVFPRVKDDPLLDEIRSFQVKYAENEDGDVKDPEICLGYLGGVCPTNLCLKLHVAGKAYQWQIMNVGGSPDDPNWLNLPGFLSEELEIAFSHLDDQEDEVQLLPIDEVEPHVDDATGDGNGNVGPPGFDTVVKLLGPGRYWKADFSDPKKMKILSEDGRDTLDLRRLATPSSAVGKSSFATEYKWYFKDERGRWVEYGSVSQNAEGQEVSKSQIGSSDIEVKFMSQQSTMTFVAGMFQYQIDFQAMTQTNTQTGKARELLRRPRKISRPEALAVFRAPPHWEKMKKNELFRLVDVLPGSAEFLKIQTFFASFGGIPWSGTITKLVRIQNLYLYNRYEARKAAMFAERNNDATKVNEMTLFHGTSAHNVLSISEHGFVWQLAGTANAVAFGRGVYFGTNWNISTGYARGGHHLFIAKVLVGRSTPGSNGLVKPAAPFDTTFGRDLFVVYEEDAMYPEYSVYF